MPDLERLARNLELDLATSSYERALIQARHKGEDQARWQIVKAAIAAAIATVIYNILG